MKTKTRAAQPDATGTSNVANQFTITCRKPDA